MSTLYNACSMHCVKLAWPDSKQIVRPSTNYYDCPSTKATTLQSSCVQLYTACIVSSDQTRLCFLAGLVDAEAAASAVESQPQHSSNPMTDNAQQRLASQALPSQALPSQPPSQALPSRALPSQPPHQTTSLSQPAVSLVTSPLMLNHNCNS